MLTNYFKTAWRNVVKNKIYSVLNIFGLTVGMAVALLIGLWVYNQYSFDRFLPNYNQLYQVQLNFTSQHDGTHTQTAIAIPLAEVLRTEIPGIKDVAETDWIGNQYHDLLVGNKKLYLDGGAAASHFLKMFRFHLIKGNAASVLNDPFSIVINESTAKALFGNADPINKVIRIDNSHDVKVTGVMQDIPQNSSIKFSYLLPFSFNEQTQDWMKNARTTWTNNSFQIFVELQPQANMAQINSKIKHLIFQRSPQMRAGKPEIFLYPLEKWHLYSNFKNGKQAGGFIDYVRMFSFIGILVLLIACINFMNLATARSEKRAREVGVRKAIGSRRIDLIYQFLTESIVITSIAFIFSILVVQLLLPSFNLLTESVLKIPYGNPVFWAIMISYVLITGLLAGSRPAFYLSSFAPAQVLKGSVQVGRAASLPRKVLVVLQFSCSIALIISTIIVYQQIQFAKNRPTGYSANRLIMTDMSDDLSNHYDALKSDLLNSRMVKSVAKASSPVTGIYIHMSLDKWPGKNGGDESVNIGAISVSDTYFKTLGMTLKAGHDFSTNWSADTNNVIVNEAMVNRIGLKNPIGQLITYNQKNNPVRIIGVVKDALMESPFTPVAPAIFNHGRGGNNIMYRLSAQVNIHDAIEKVTKIFNTYNPAYPFSYRFVDDEYNNKFNLEILVGKLAGIFAGLAIFISCLGLFGLAVYVAEQRTKEIGIRKVLGASVLNIWHLLSKDFVILVVISFLISVPVSYYFMHNWLQNYHYHTELSWWIFAAAGISSLLITVLVVSFQAIKAALANPVKSLRSE